MALTYEEVSKKMESRGFREVMRHMNGSEIMQVSFCYAATSRIPAYMCDIFLRSDEFQLSYIVGNTISVLTTSKCGSVMDDSHFDRISSKFEEQVIVLHKYCEQ